MRQSHIEILVLMFVLSLTFGGCKKYEEGPWISLRSKNARLIGDWKLKEYTSTRYTNNNQGENTIITTFDGENITTSGSNTKAYSHQLNLMKGGTYQETIVYDGDKSEYNGLWTWVDDESKKAQLQYGDRIYTIIKLKNKELKLSYFWENNHTVGSNINIISIKREFTFVQ